MLFLSNQRLRKWQRKFQLFKEISLFFFQISFYLILLALSPLDYHQFLALSPLTPVIFIPTSPAYLFIFFSWLYSPQLRYSCTRLEKNFPTFPIQIPDFKTDPCVGSHKFYSTSNMPIWGSCYDSIILFSGLVSNTRLS